MVDGLRDVLACLDDVEATVWEPYRHEGAGRPPRNPLGILKALVVKRVRGIPSDESKASAERAISRLKQHLSIWQHPSAHDCSLIVFRLVFVAFKPLAF